MPESTMHPQSAQAISMRSKVAIGCVTEHVPAESPNSSTDRAESLWPLPRSTQTIRDTSTRPASWLEWNEVPMGGIWIYIYTVVIAIVAIVLVRRRREGHSST
jgi:hypothetical protein